MLRAFSYTCTKMTRNRELLSLKATAFLSDGRQPEVDFLHHWAVVWLKLSGKSFLKEKRKLAMKI